VSTPAGAAERDGSPEPRLRDGVRYCLLVFLAVRLGLSVLSMATVTLIEPRSDPPPPAVEGWPIGPLSPGWHNAATATERQDAARFLAIATQGYRPGDGSAAFLPLYPVAVRLVAWLPLVGPLGAALVVSNAAFVGALVVLYALTELEFRSRRVARLAVLFLAVFPTAFFFMAPYSESLFLLLALSACWCARRSRWGGAAVAAALAAQTRAVGLVLAPALATEALLAWRRSGRSPVPGLGAAAATLAGPLAYLGYWQLRFGDWAGPIDAQRAWQRDPTWPWVSVRDATDLALRLGSYWLVDLVVVGTVLLAVLAGVRTLRPTYMTYAGLSLLVPLCAPLPGRPLLSMPRFVAVIFPAFWVLARAVERRGLSPSLVTAPFAAGYGVLFTLFANWWHIF
jgi:hypothetical protein